MPGTLVDHAELIRALGVLLDEPAGEHGAVARAVGLPAAPESGAFARLFVLNLYPYASVQVGDEGMMGGEARDRVAGFWRAVGLTPPPEPDHLGALLGLWAALEEGAGSGNEAERVMQRQAVDALLWEHLLPWAPAYLARARELGDPYYAGWAGILLELLEERAGPVTERMASGEAKSASLPLHLRAAPGLPDPRTPVRGAGERFMDALLAPVRSGMILTRLDLLRAGRQLGLGVRVGERKYTLRALFGQDPQATLGWLSEEAEAWARRHGNQEAAFGPIARYWRDRAQQTAALLSELASSEAASEWAEPSTASATKGEGRDA
jgi:TorA maturation chaperone TorD